jgi:hypothetical protein
MTVALLRTGNLTNPRHRSENGACQRSHLGSTRVCRVPPGTSCLFFGLPWFEATGAKLSSHRQYY